MTDDQREIQNTQNFWLWGNKSQWLIIIEKLPNPGRAVEYLTLWKYSWPTNWFSEILKLNSVSILHPGNFNHYSEKFPATAYDSLLKWYGRYFDALPLKTELSVEGFLLSNIWGLLKYFIPSNLRMVFAEVTKLSITSHSNSVWWEVILGSEEGPYLTYTARRLRKD